MLLEKIQSAVRVVAASLLCIGCVAADEDTNLMVNRAGDVRYVKLSSAPFPIPDGFELVDSSEGKLDFRNPGPMALAIATERGLWLDSVGQIVIEPRLHEQATLDDESKAQQIAKCGALQIWKIQLPTQNRSTTGVDSIAMHIFSDPKHIVIVASLDPQLWRTVIENYRVYNTIPVSSCNT